MMGYKKALTLIHDQKDGVQLLPYSLFLQKQFHIGVILAHLANNFTEMQGLLDESTLNALQQIENKNDLFFIHQLEKNNPVHIKELLICSELKKLKQFITENHVDLLILGHHNNLLARFTSTAFELINHLEIDVIVKHIK